jgi:hypothetical protein
VNARALGRSLSSAAHQSRMDASLSIDIGAGNSYGGSSSYSNDDGSSGPRNSTTSSSNRRKQSAIGLALDGAGSSDDGGEDAGNKAQRSAAQMTGNNCDFHSELFYSTCYFTPSYI